MVQYILVGLPVAIALTYLRVNIGWLKYLEFKIINEQDLGKMNWHSELLSLFYYVVLILNEGKELGPALNQWIEETDIESLTNQQSFTLSTYPSKWLKSSIDTLEELKDRISQTLKPNN